MIRLLYFSVMFLCASAIAADRITATVTLTNAAGTVNGETIAVNGDSRIWTNVVNSPTTQILTNSTRETAKTNAYKAIGIAPFSQVSLLDRGTTNFDLVGGSGVALTVTLSSGWATVGYSTQSVAVLLTVRVPVSAETATVQTNNASYLVAAIDSSPNTNSIHENSKVAANLVGITNVQTITGDKTFAGGIGGKVDTLTNGIYKSPVFTNAVNYGNPFSSPGSGVQSEQFGLASAASGISSFAAGSSATAVADNSTAIGEESYVTTRATNSTAIGSLAEVDDINGVALGKSAWAKKPGSMALGTSVVADHTNSSAVGYGATTTANNQIALGQAASTVSIPGGLIAGTTSNIMAGGTNVFPTGSDISFSRFAITTLANGNNAAVPVGTNVFIEVSGPSGVFTINGIAGGRDGKLLVLLNQTGQNMTVANQSGTDPAAANRIVCLTGADKTVTGNSSALLIYSGSASRWILLSFTQ